MYFFSFFFTTRFSFPFPEEAVRAKSPTGPYLIANRTEFCFVFDRVMGEAVQMEAEYDVYKMKDDESSLE